MDIEGEFEIDIAREVVWDKITDPQLMVGCIPGCEDIEEIDPTHYRAVVGVSVGIVRARFNVQVEIIREEPPNAIYTRMRGDEGTRASTVSAETVLRLYELPAGGTRVSYSSEVDVAGRLGNFGLGMMRKKAAVLGNEFTENFCRRLQGGNASVSPVEKLREKKTSGWRRLFSFSWKKTKDLSPAEPIDDFPFTPKSVAAARSDRTVLRPESVEDAVTLLERHENVLPLSGGATLIAMKNANLIHADRFVSLEGIKELQGVTVASNGAIRIGAMNRHCQTAASTKLQNSLSVLKKAAGMIANPPVRHMGTIGGSLANADPAADYLPALACLDAELELAGSDGRRRISIVDFLVDWHSTALQRGEIITAVYLPPAVPGRGAYRKVARVSGDYATASCATSVRTHPQFDVQVAIGGCGPFPIRSREAEAKLISDGLSTKTIARFGESLAELADPIDDVRGTAEFRLRLIPRLVAEAIHMVRGQQEFSVS